MNHPAPSDEELYRLARRRVGAKIGLAIHATVYLLVNTLLWIGDQRTGGAGWSQFPLLGWGLGLAIHATVVALSLVADHPGNGLVRREAERLRRRSS
jgi:2TM domain